MVQRAFPYAVGGLLAVAAWFQAAGISALVGAELVASPKLAPASRVAPPLPSDPEPDAEPILARNPFDSVTGPLLEEARGETQRAKRRGPIDPLKAPKCDGVYVDATTESTDPLWSIAVVQGPGEKHGRVRRVGDAVSGKKVAYIGFNPREREPAVWLLEETSGELCQSFLFDEAPKPKVKPKPKPNPKKRVRRRVAPPLPKELSKKIEKISDTEYGVDRGAVDLIVRDYSKLLKGTVVKPVTKNGKVIGVRLSRSNPQSLLGRLGLRNGDVIQSINGFRLSSPEKALQAYARLRTASEIRIQIERGGKPTTIDVHVK